MITAEGSAQFVLRQHRLIPIAAYTPADRVAALVAQRGISGDVAAVFVLGGARLDAVKALAKERKVIA
jgi:hypothetical protein